MYKKCSALGSGEFEDPGKIKRLKTECNKCEVATYMADHPDRFTCGKCDHMLYRLMAKGERLPIPENKKPAVAAGSGEYTSINHTSNNSA